MSRDFAPAERYYSNKQSGDNLWLHNISFHYEGQTKPMYTDEEQAIRLRYPNLAVAMCSKFLPLYRSIPEPDREKVLSELEKRQVKLQEAFDKGATEFYSCDVPETMKDWFMGKLDPSFYYAEVNDQLYFDWLIKEIGGKVNGSVSGSADDRPGNTTEPGV